MWGRPASLSLAAAVFAISLAVLVVPPRLSSGYGGWLPDRPSYELGAMRLARGEGHFFSLNGERLPALYPPGAPLFYSWLYRWTDPSERTAIYPWCGVVAAFAVVLLFCAVSLAAGRLAGLIAVGLMLTSPLQETLQVPLSELPTFVCGVLLLALGLGGLGGSRWRVVACVAVGGVLAGFATWIRITNLVLVFAPVALALVAGRTWRARTGLALLAGFCALPPLVWQLLQNASEFGHPLRSGHAVWDSYWFDANAIGWRYAIFGGSPLERVPMGNLFKHLLDLTGATRALLPQGNGSPFDAALVAAGAYAAWRVRDAAVRLVALTFALVGLPLLVFYSVFAFRHFRYLLAAWPWAVALAAMGASWLIRHESLRLRRLGVVLTVAALLFGGVHAARGWWPVPWLSARTSIDGLRPHASLEWLRSHAEPDALVVSAFNAAELETLVVDGTRRTFAVLRNPRILPRLRPEDYAIQVVCAQRPSGPPLPSSALEYDAWALERGCRRVEVPTVVSNLDWIEAEVLRGRPVYAEDESVRAFPGNAPAFGLLRERFELRAVASRENWTVFRVHRRARE